MMQVSEAKSQQIWEKKSRELLSKYPILKPRINGRYVAYNISHGMAIDLWESFFQKVSLDSGIAAGWTAFKRFVSKIPGKSGKAADFFVKANEAASGIIRDGTLSKQLEKYRWSIEQGHGVVTVAHSQGNLFTAEAFLKLKPWMEPYFHTIAVATPASKIPNNGKGVTFYNDIINLVPYSMNNNINNPNKYDYYPVNAVGETLPLLTDQKSAQYHEFDYYLGYPVYEEALIVGSSDKTTIEQRQTNEAKDIILQWMYDEIIDHHTRDSQWKLNEESNEGTKDYRVTLVHIKDPENIKLDFDVYPFNLDGKLYQLKNSGDYVKASFGGKEILDANYYTWENQKDNQFYFLQGTTPAEYIVEKACKDPSNFEIISHQNKNTANWRITVKNKEANKIQSDVYPFKLDGSLYQLENDGEWVLASCGGSEIKSVWDNQQEHEFYKLIETDDIITITNLNQTTAKIA